VIFVHVSKTSGHCPSPKEEKDFYILFRYFIFVRSVVFQIFNTGALSQLMDTRL
jgi:hypothetical protein